MSEYDRRPFLQFFQVAFRHVLLLLLTRESEAGRSGRQVGSKGWDTAMQPSTLRIKFALFRVVICSSEWQPREHMSTPESCSAVRFD